MPDCPNCHKTIDFLVNSRAVIMSTPFRLVNGKPALSTFEDFHISQKAGPDVVNDYGCPICLYTIAENEEDAIRFLQPLTVPSYLR